eukprot:363337-Chlamydomonas_euryale.AAC.9
MPGDRQASKHDQVLSFSPAAHRATCRRSNHGQLDSASRPRTTTVFVVATLEAYGVAAERAVRAEMRVDFARVAGIGPNLGMPGSSRKSI